MGRDPHIEAVSLRFLLLLLTIDGTIDLTTSRAIFNLDITMQLLRYSSAYHAAAGAAVEFALVIRAAALFHVSLRRFFEIHEATLSQLRIGGGGGNESINIAQQSRLVDPVTCQIKW